MPAMGDRSSHKPLFMRIKWEKVVIKRSGKKTEVDVNFRPMSKVISACFDEIHQSEVGFMVLEALGLRQLLRRRHITGKKPKLK
jgi:hypothetical protein